MIVWSTELKKVNYDLSCLVRPLSGAKIVDLEAHFRDLLHKDFEKVLLHMRRKDHLGKRGLHLNAQDNEILASDFLNAIWY